MSRPLGTDKKVRVSVTSAVGTRTSYMMKQDQIPTKAVTTFMVIISSKKRQNLTYTILPVGTASLAEYCKDRVIDPLTIHDQPPKPPILKTVMRYEGNLWIRNVSLPVHLLDCKGEEATE